MRRKQSPLKPDLRQQWQIDQGNACPCRGHDDMCACQNESAPWKYGLGGSPPPTREQELGQRVRELEGHVRTLELQQQTDRQTIATVTAQLTEARSQVERWREAAGPFVRMGELIDRYADYAGKPRNALNLSEYGHHFRRLAALYAEAGGEKTTGQENDNG